LAKLVRFESIETKIQFDPLTAIAPDLIDVLPADARRVLIGVNRSAGAGVRQDAADHLTRELAARRIEATVVDSLPEVARQSAEMLHSGELRSVVAIGGDGTAAEIVNRTPVGTPVAIYPTGTENLLAKYLGIGKNAAEIAQMIADGRTAWLDAGRAGERIFLLMASAGFDADVVHRLHTGRSGNIRHWSYLKPIWQAIRSYQYPELRVRCALEQTGNSSSTLTPALSKGEREEGKALAWGEPISCRWAFAFNLPKYGFGLRFAPAANGTDGEFDVCTFRRGGLVRGLGYLSSIVLGFHRRLAACEYVKCSRVRIESDEPVHYELDGDPGGTLPVELEVVPRRLRLIVPSNFSPT
jgi:diacylglycerol kinase family enzyme